MRIHTGILTTSLEPLIQCFFQTDVDVEKVGRARLRCFVRLRMPLLRASQSSKGHFLGLKKCPFLSWGKKLRLLTLLRELPPGVTSPLISRNQPLS